MLIPFNTTVQGDFWQYQIKVVPLHRHSEKPPTLVSRNGKSESLINNQ